MSNRHRERFDRAPNALACFLALGLALLSPRLVTAQMTTGTYVGDGTLGRKITSVGFQPDVVIVKGDDSDGDYSLTSTILRSSTMVGDSSKPMVLDNALVANEVQSLDADGFTVGSARRVNQSGVTFYWAAFKVDADMSVGTYTGNGGARSVSSLGFSPEYVIVMSSANRRAVHAASAAPVGRSFEFESNAWLPNQITSLDPTGFSVVHDGAAPYANASGVVYHYVAWNDAPPKTKVGSYPGNGADNRSITGVGFRPEYLIVKAIYDNNVLPLLTPPGHQRYAQMVGDATYNFAIGPGANLLQAFQVDGFQVGSALSTNRTFADCNLDGPGCTYFYVAFNAATTYHRSIGTRDNYGTVGPEGLGTTVTATNGSATVTGSGTAWKTANRGRGDRIRIDGTDYTILWINSATELILTSSFTGTTGSGKTYTIARQFMTLQAWEDCISFAVSPCPYFPVSSADLVADNRREVGIAYDDSIVPADPDFTTGVIIDGSTTDANHNITLTADGDNRHYGIVGAGALLDSTTAPDPDDEIRIHDANVVVEWLEIRGIRLATTKGGVRVVGAGATNILLRNLLVHDNANGIRLSSAAGKDLTVRNSIVYDNDDVGIEGDELGDTLTIDNCTVFGNVFAGINGVSSTVAVRNTISMHNGTDYLNVGTQENNISEDGTATGPGSLANRDHTDLASPPAPPQGNGWAMFQNLGVGTEDFHLRDDPAQNEAQDNGTDLSSSFFADIDGQLRVTPWDIGADDVDATTAVKLVSFEAQGLDSAVELQWETASELNNLGFHLYRAMSARGPYEQITTRAIPGLGSSPVGAQYRYQDTGLANGVTYFYKLEDIETAGKTELHGPVSATPMARVSSGGDDTDSGGSTSNEAASTSLITYGDPTANSFRVVKRDKTSAVLELVTEGFYAEPLEDGSVRLEVPGFESLAELLVPGVPVKRAWVEAVAGRKVKLLSVRSGGVEAFTSLRPSGSELPEIVATPEGTVRVAQRRRRAKRAFLGDGLNPSSAARIVSVGFQGDVKKALVELAPLRWDGTKGQLLLARRLVVRVSFHGREPTERILADGVRGRRYARKRSHDRRTVVARLETTERGLHSVRYEDVMRGRRGGRAKTLRLSRQGETVAFHLEPNGSRFKPGSTLYFLSEGASANPYGREAVYELELGRAGDTMPRVSAAPSGEPTRFYWHRAEWEEDRYYQAALLEAPDLWLWDLLFAPVVKSYPFEVSALALSALREPSKLSVWLQGVSDFRANPDHHVRVYVNGTLVEELSWDGKQAKHLEVALTPGLLREGDNLLELENVGDTEAAYSMVMLDRYAVEYPRVALTGDGRLEGRWSESGAAELSGLSAGTHVLDMSGAQPSWLLDTEFGADGLLRFRAESGRSYLAVSPEAVYHPAVTKPRASRLKNVRNRADYLVIGPEAFLRAAIPLLELRRSDGLKVKAVSIEEVYAEFGFGEPTPEAVKDFLSYAYHNWRQPSPRYVLLLGDATFDFKDFLQTGVTNQVPPRMVKTSYLWTASDPSYAAVNGEDILPDFSIGRLPAATVDEVHAMVEKTVAYETGEAGLHRSAVVLVADNPDRAGNFEADADRLAASVLASKNPDKIYLSQLGTAATRDAILQSFDDGASLVSYMGHGGIHLWADENFFNVRDVASLAPQTQQPLVLTMNCLNGYFHFPYFNSLAEELVKTSDKGAIAAFSPSGLSLNGPADLFHQALLEELFNGAHPRLGDAVLAAQEAYAETGAFPELLSIYHLLGDPALRLR